MFTGNYASIMKVFTKTVEKLNTRAKALDMSCQAREVQIEALNRDQASERAEMIKCLGTAAKIEKEFIM